MSFTQRPTGKQSFKRSSVQVLVALLLLGCQAPAPQVGQAPSAAPAQSTPGKLVGARQISPVGGSIETEKIKVSIPQQAQATEVAVYEQPSEALRQENPQAFGAETTLGSAFEIQSLGRGLSLQHEPIRVELSIDMDKIPAEQRNTANTYAQVWNGNEWEPVFGAVDPKGKLRVNLRHVPASGSLKIVPVTSQNYEQVSQSLEGFTTQQEEGKVYGNAGITRVVVVYTKSIPSQAPTSSEAKVREAEQKRTEGLNIPGSEHYHWCRDSCNDGNLQCVSRDFRVVSQGQASKIARFVIDALRFYAQQGFKSPLLKPDPEGNLIIYANGWEGAAKRSDGQYKRTYGLYDSTSQNLVLYMGYAETQSDEQLRGWIAHELFHAVQTAYTQNTRYRENPNHRFITEGTANAMAGWFQHGRVHTQYYQFRSESSAFRGFPVSEPLLSSANPNFAYQTEQFWVHAQKQMGANVVRELFESVEKSPQQGALQSAQAFFQAKSTSLGGLYKDFINQLISQQMIAAYYTGPTQDNQSVSLNQVLNAGYSANQKLSIPGYASIIYKPEDMFSLLKGSLKIDVPSGVGVQEYKSYYIVTNPNASAVDFAASQPGQYASPFASKCNLDIESVFHANLGGSNHRETVLLEEDSTIQALSFTAPGENTQVPLGGYYILRLKSALTETSNLVLELYKGNTLLGQAKALDNQTFEYPVNTSALGLGEQTFRAVLKQPGNAGKLAEAISAKLTIQKAEQSTKSDGGGGSSTPSNSAPAQPVCNSCPGSAVATQAVTLSLGLSDPNSGDTVSAKVNWGDGSAETESSSVTGSGTVSVSHTYATPGGPYSIKITAKDNQGKTSSELSRSITVDPAYNDLELILE